METVFTVLAERARSRSLRFLITESALCSGGSVLLVLWNVNWWPFAALMTSMAAMSGWGIVDRLATTRVAPRAALGAVRTGLVAAGTLAAVLFVIGLALAAFTGNSPGPYGTCVSGGRPVSCRVLKEPRPVVRSLP
jgi:Na+(H+)/acetate symporter ActP